jgi:antirestriction protein ArdC
MTSTKIKTRKTADERRAEADQLHDSITGQLEELTSSEGWARFLATATGFHRYSLSNVLLIQSQRPDATRVAGFRQWQARGRQVRKGERSIKIFGYSTKRIEPDENSDSDEEERRTFYPILSVFDISQTDPIDGVDEVPDFAPRLKGGDDAGIYDATAAWLTEQGWTVTRETLPQEDGSTSIDGTRAVRIHDELSPAHAAVTILHEAGHALMHSELTDYHQHRGIYETEAESVAYITAGVLGLDTSANSIGYIAGWTRGDVETVKATAARVLATVRTILDGITEADDPR